GVGGGGRERREQAKGWLFAGARRGDTQKPPKTAAPPTCLTEGPRGGLEMKLPRRNFLHLAAGAAALPVLSRIARAQAYPSRPITVFVPYPPGVGTDSLARVLAEHMKGTLGRPVIVENATGAGGTIGTARVARVLGEPHLNEALGLRQNRWRSEFALWSRREFATGRKALARPLASRMREGRSALERGRASGQTRAAVRPWRHRLWGADFATPDCAPAARAGQERRTLGQFEASVIPNDAPRQGRKSCQLDRRQPVQSQGA